MSRWFLLFSDLLDERNNIAAISNASRRFLSRCMHSTLQLSIIWSVKFTQMELGLAISFHFFPEGGATKENRKEIGSPYSIDGNFADQRPNISSIEPPFIGPIFALYFIKVS